MNILVTGGAGYIGSHTALALRQAGFTPVVLDSLVTGHEWAVKYGPFVRGDVGDAAVERALCAEYKPEALIHFAAFIDVGESVANPKKYIENNYHKAVRLFETAQECGVKKVVFSSSAAVYGVPQDEKPIKEDHPLLPINPYGESKLMAEMHLRSLKEVQSVTLRYFNAAGAAPIEEGLGEAHNPETHLIPNAIGTGLGRGKPLRIFGADYPTPDGTAIRDYVHVMDLAAAHVAALRYLLGGGASEVCNLGTGKGSSVQEVVGAVERAWGESVPKIVQPRRAGDPPRLVADVSRAEKLLGWEARSSLQEIVESALAWHRSEAYSRAVRFSIGAPCSSPKTCA
jgi:UDP-glucose-4-epimerase GalE